MTELGIVCARNACLQRSSVQNKTTQEENRLRLPEESCRGQWGSAAGGGGRNLPGSHRGAGCTSTLVTPEGLQTAPMPFLTLTGCYH